MQNTERSIAMLTVHRDNLLVAKTFEEYRAMHVAYVEMLIEQLKADQTKDESVHRWMVTTEIKSDAEVVSAIHEGPQS